MSKDYNKPWFKAAIQSEPRIAFQNHPACRKAATDLEDVR